MSLGCGCHKKPREAIKQQCFTIMHIGGTRSHFEKLLAVMVARCMRAIGVLPVGRLMGVNGLI
jgi:hypothetical protein